jgi:hypothetical protein
MYKRRERGNPFLKPLVALKKGMGKPLTRGEIHELRMQVETQPI